MKTRTSYSGRIAAEKAQLPDELLTNSQSGSKCELVAEFSGQTLFEVPADCMNEFIGETARSNSVLMVNGVTYFPTLAYSFVESNGKLYVTWSEGHFALDPDCEIYLVRL